MSALNTHGIIQCLVSMTLAVILSGCVTNNVTLAPGADQIRVTKVATDVASCVVVGNVDGESGSGMVSDGIRQLQNQTLGVGGNTVLVTMNTPPQKGIAYRCGPASGQAR